jgi:hypothetical protein
LIGEEMDFPAGPVQLPASRHPKLLLEWTLTARVKNSQADDPQPTKKLIVRAYPTGDTSGLSCWAWYTWVSRKRVHSFHYSRRSTRLFSLKQWY